MLGVFQITPANQIFSEPVWIELHGSVKCQIKIQKLQNPWKVQLKELKKN